MKLAKTNENILDDFSQYVYDVKKETQEKKISDEKEALYRYIYNCIDDYDTNLRLIDIGKVLVKLANNYLNE